MYYVAYKILRDAQQSEDAVHTAFLKIIKRFSDLGEISCLQILSTFVYISEGNFKAYLDIVKWRVFVLVYKKVILPLFKLKEMDLLNVENLLFSRIEIVNPQTM